MKHLLLGLFLMPFLGIAQFKITSPHAEHYSEAPLSVYKEPAGVTKIGEIPPGSRIIFIIGSGDLNTYLVYRKGVVGYASKSQLFIQGRKPVFSDTIIEPRLATAKREEAEYDKYWSAKAEKERQEKDIKREQLLKAGLGVTYPEYVDGEFYCGYDISFTNYSSKTIKYIYLTLSAYNSVDDLVASKRFSLVGPIQTMQDANYKNRYAFDGKKAISFFVIKKIEVLYTNGSRKDYSGEIIKAIIVD